MPESSHGARRIGLLADQLHRTSGVGVHARELVSALVRVADHHALTLIYPGDMPVPDAVAALPALRHVRLPRRALLYPAWHLGLRTPIERWTGPLDLLHVLSGSCTVRSRAPQLITVHDLASMQRPDDFPARRRWLKHTYLRRAARGEAHVSAISEWTAHDVVELLGLSPERVHVVHNGLDTGRFNAPDASAVKALRARLDLPDRFLLFVGAVSPRKNVDTLLRAFAHIAERRPELHLVLAGSKDGWDSVRVQDVLGSPALRARVRELGYVDDRDLPALYAAARAFVFPSLYEGFGLPLIEAMACGTPVVSADATCLPEIAGDAALLVDARSVQSLADGMQRVVEDDTLAGRLRRLGLARAAQFDWEVAAQKSVSLYDALISKGERCTC